MFKDERERGKENAPSRSSAWRACACSSVHSSRCSSRRTYESREMHQSPTGRLPKKKRRNIHSDQPTGEASDACEVKRCSGRSERGERAEVEVLETLVVKLVRIDFDRVVGEVLPVLRERVKFLAEVDTWEDKGGHAAVSPGGASGENRRVVAHPAGLRPGPWAGAW